MKVIRHDQNGPAPARKLVVKMPAALSRALDAAGVKASRLQLKYRPERKAKSMPFIQWLVMGGKQQDE